MFNKLPEELNNKILDYVYGCKKTQDFYITKEVVIYISNKFKRCKKINIFNKPICYGCYETEIKHVYNMLAMIDR